jgi:16S rRNA (uracil1498-N3)-methyltransferase
VKRPAHQANRPKHRFAVDADQVRGDEVHFSATVAYQLRHVLRLRPGERVTVFDGTGLEFSVTLRTLRDQEAVGLIDERRQLSSEPRLHLTLYQALLPREKFEQVLQKGAEIGVSAFRPVVTERSLVPASALDGKRLDRWRRILAEAAEQCGRATVPSLDEPTSLRDALQAAGDRPILLAWERERALGVRQALEELLATSAVERLALFVGPEGGFAAGEVEAAAAAGARLISLGPRLLRTETAGPLLAGLAMYVAGELEPAL